MAKIIIIDDEPAMVEVIVTLCREKGHQVFPFNSAPKAIEQLDSIGLLVDFVDIKKLIRTIVGRLDHQFLNDVPPFDAVNPSAENMARYFYDEITSGLETPGPRIREVKIWETDITSATYRPLTPASS